MASSEGQVSMETFLFAAGAELFQAPLTYRGAPLVSAEAALITEMSHSVLGNRWVYDGWRDALFVVMLAGVAMTGRGEALGMANYDGRWHIARPTSVFTEEGGGKNGCPSTGSSSPPTTQADWSYAATGSH